MDTPEIRIRRRPEPGKVYGLANLPKGARVAVVGAPGLTATVALVGQAAVYVKGPAQLRTVAYTDRYTGETKDVTFSRSAVVPWSRGTVVEYLGQE